MATHYCASIMAVIGRTGSGKSTLIKGQLKKSRGKIFCWDFKREYQGEGFTCTDNLAEFIKLAQGRKKKIAFCPSMNEKTRWKQFDLFCRLAYKLGQLTVLVEELSFVTTPQKAPDAWRLITLTGRHEGLKVIATSQRPASVDKDFFGNCTRIICFSLNYANDIAVMANSLLIEKEKITALAKGQYYERGENNRVNMKKILLK